MIPEIIEIKILDHSFAQILSFELSKESKEYLKYFTPFDFSFSSLEKVLTKSKNDKYFGIFVNNSLAGFYMLRGFDEGYEIPSYGVWISSKFSNRGLSALTLHHAFAFCKLNGIKILLLKVHPENVVAKKLYESLGFVKIGVDERNGNFIYHKKF
jgi:RimJ/RimL family protein N-acetyltransferase